VKRILLLALCLAYCAAGHAAAGNLPFPEAKRPVFGLSPSVSAEVMDRVTDAAFLDWLGRYVTTEGCPAGAYRVHRYLAYDYDTVSEGIGWGMLITAIMDNDAHPTKSYFDGLWRYYRANLNNYGLMKWKISRAGIADDIESASDADQNVALALFYAHKQWQDADYLRAAKALLKKIMAYEVATNKRKEFILKPGTKWGGFGITNLSYYNPAYYRSWESYDRRFGQLLRRAEMLYGYFSAHYDTGLYPDWCTSKGGSTYLSYNYTYDATHIPLKLGLDFRWNGEHSRELKKLTAWAVKATQGRPELIVDGYRLDGTPTGNYNNAPFVGPLAVAALAASNQQAWLDKCYAQLVGLGTGGRFGYFNDTLRLISLIIISGNWPDLWPTKQKQPEQSLRGWG